MAHQLKAQRLYRQRDFGRAIAHAQLAVTLAPNEAENYVTVAMAYLFSGQPAKVLELTATGMRLDPNFPGRYLARQGLAKFALRDYSGAIEDITKAFYNRRKSARTNSFHSAT